MSYTAKRQDNGIVCFLRLTNHRTREGNETYECLQSYTDCSFTVSCVVKPIFLSNYVMCFSPFSITSNIRVTTFCISKSKRILCLIHMNGFWFVHIPFGSMDKFQFFVQFPIDHLSHPIMSSHTFRWSYFAAFAYYVSNRFISFST